MIVHFLSEIILVISNRMSAFDFEITRMISDQIALHSLHKYNNKTKAWNHMKEKVQFSRECLVSRSTTLAIAPNAFMYIR